MPLLWHLGDELNDGVAEWFIRPHGYGKCGFSTTRVAWLDAGGIGGGRMDSACSDQRTGDGEQLPTSASHFNFLAATRQSLVVGFEWME